MKYNRNNSLKRTRKGWIIIPLALLSVCVGSAIHNNNVHASNRNSVEPVNTQNTNRSLRQPNLVNDHLAKGSMTSVTPQMINNRANGLRTGIINRAFTQAKATNSNNNTQPDFQSKNNRRLLGQSNNTPGSNVKYGQGIVTVPIYEKSQGRKNLANNVTITIREPVGSTTALWALFSGKSPVYTYSGHSLQSANGNVTVDKLGRVSLSPDAEVTYVGNSNGLDGLRVTIPVNNSNGDSIVLQLPDDVSVGSDILLNNGMIKSNPGNKYSIRGDVPIYYSDGPNDIVHKIQEYGTIVDNSKAPSSSATQNPSSSSANLNSSKASLSSNTNASRSANSTSNSSESSRSNAVSSHSSSIPSAGASSATSSTNVNSSNASTPSQESTSSVSGNPSTVDSNVNSNTGTGAPSINNNGTSGTDSSISSNNSLVPNSINSQNTQNTSMPNVSSNNDSVNNNSVDSKTSDAPVASQKAPLSVTSNSSTVNSDVNVKSNSINNRSDNDNKTSTPSSVSSMNNGVNQSGPSEAAPNLNSATDNKSVSSQKSSDPVDASSTNSSNVKSKGLLALKGSHDNVSNVGAASLNKADRLPQTGDYNHSHSILNASTLLILSAMLLGLATDVDKHRFN